MPCPWNLQTDDPDPDTRTLRCRCGECGRYAELHCERDFASGALVVQVRTCREKGGTLGMRERQ